MKIDSKAYVKKESASPSSTNNEQSARYWSNLSPRRFQGLASPLFSETKRGKQKYSASLVRPPAAIFEAQAQGYSDPELASKSDVGEEEQVREQKVDMPAEIITIMVPNTPDGTNSNTTGGPNLRTTMNTNEIEHFVHPLQSRGNESIIENKGEIVIEQDHQVRLQSAEAQAMVSNDTTSGGAATLHVHGISGELNTQGIFNKISSFQDGPSTNQNSKVQIDNRNGSNSNQSKMPSGITSDDGQANQISPLNLNLNGNLLHGKNHDFSALQRLQPNSPTFRDAGDSPMSKGNRHTGMSTFSKEKVQALYKGSTKDQRSGEFPTLNEPRTQSNLSSPVFKQKEMSPQHSPSQMQTEQSCQNSVDRLQKVADNATNQIRVQTINVRDLFQEQRMQYNSPMSLVSYQGQTNSPGLSPAQRRSNFVLNPNESAQSFQPRQPILNPDLNQTSATQIHYFQQKEQTNNTHKRKSSISKMQIMTQSPSNRNSNKSIHKMDRKDPPKEKAPLFGNKKPSKTSIGFTTMPYDSTMSIALHNPPHAYEGQKQIQFGSSNHFMDPKFNPQISMSTMQVKPKKVELARGITTQRMINPKLHQLQELANQPLSTTYMEPHKVNFQVLNEKKTKQKSKSPLNLSEFQKSFLYTANPKSTDTAGKTIDLTGVLNNKCLLMTMPDQATQDKQFPISWNQTHKQSNNQERVVSQRTSPSMAKVKKGGRKTAQPVFCIQKQNMNRTCQKWNGSGLNDSVMESVYERDQATTPQPQRPRASDIMFQDEEFKRHTQNGPFVHNFNSSRVSSPPLNRKLLHKTHSSNFHDSQTGSPTHSNGEIRQSLLKSKSKRSESSTNNKKTSVILKFKNELHQDESSHQPFRPTKNLETPFMSTTENSTRGHSRMFSPKNEKNNKLKLKQLSPRQKDHLITEQLRLMDHAKQKQASKTRTNNRRNSIANQIGISLNNNSSSHLQSGIAQMNKTQNFSMKRGSMPQGEANQMLMTGKPTQNVHLPSMHKTVTPIRFPSPDPTKQILVNISSRNLVGVGKDIHMPSFQFQKAVQGLKKRRQTLMLEDKRTVDRITTHKLDSNMKILEPAGPNNRDDNEHFSQFSVVSSNLVASPKLDNQSRLEKKKAMQIGAVTVNSGPKAYQSNLTNQFEDSLVILPLPQLNRNQATPQMSQKERVAVMLLPQDSAAESGRHYVHEGSIAYSNNAFSPKGGRTSSQMERQDQIMELNVQGKHYEPGSKTYRQAMQMNHQVSFQYGTPMPKSQSKEQYHLDIQNTTMTDGHKKQIGAEIVKGTKISRLKENPSVGKWQTSGIEVLAQGKNIALSPMSPQSRRQSLDDYELNSPNVPYLQMIGKAIESPRCMTPIKMQIVERESVVLTAANQTLRPQILPVVTKAAHLSTQNVQNSRIGSRRSIRTSAVPDDGVRAETAGQILSTNEDLREGINKDLQGMQRFDMAVEAGMHIDDVDGEADVQTNYADSKDGDGRGQTSTDSPMRNMAINQKNKNK